MHKLCKNLFLLSIFISVFASCQTVFTQALVAPLHEAADEVY